MSRRWQFLLALLLSLSAIPLVATRSDVVQQYVLTPLLSAIWLLMLLGSAVPQALFWALLIVLALRVAYRSLATPRRRVEAPQAATTHSLSRVQTISSWMQSARGGDYYKMQLARRLGELAVAVSSPRSLHAEDHAWQRLRERDLDAPPEVLSYFQAAVAPPQSRAADLRSTWRRFFGSRTTPATALDLDPERVVRYLEQQLESPDDRQHQTSRTT